MAKTVKTPYYYKLLKEVRGSEAEIDQSSEETEIIADTTANTPPTHTLEVPPVLQTPIAQPKPPPPKQKNGRFANLFQNLVELFSQKVQKPFPLAKVIFTKGEMAGKVFFIYNINPPDNPAGFIKIGRGNPQGEPFFIPLTSLTVSRPHAKIVFLNQKLIVVNYSKVNPTQINGKRIPFNSSVYLPEGAVVTVGEAEFIVEKFEL